MTPAEFRPCPVCGVLFAVRGTPPDGHTRYCSRRCGGVARMGVARAVPARVYVIDGEKVGSEEYFAALRRRRWPP